MKFLERSVSVAALLGVLTASPALAQDKPATTRPADLITGMLVYCWSVVDAP